MWAAEDRRQNPNLCLLSMSVSTKVKFCPTWWTVRLDRRQGRHISQTGQETGETRQSDRERERDRQALRQTDLSMLKGKQNLGTVSRVSCGTHTSAGVNGSSRNTLTTPGCFLTMLTPENLKSSYANDA